MAHDELERIRTRIDELDDQLQDLITQRAELAQEVARIKREQGESNDFYRAAREAEILRRIRDRNGGPLSDDTIVYLFREVISACLALQEPHRVAFLGPEGTFTHQAIYKHFGHSVKAMAMGAIPEVFREVEAGAAHYGVVPVENSTEGVINHTLDMFLQSPLKICGEVELRIHHHLMGMQKDLATIQRVAGHQQALAQCRNWLDTHLPHAERIALSSNAEAAQRASQGEAFAAIAGDAAAELYDLPILASNIEDEPYNTTRFLIIGERSVPASGDDKTTMLVSTHNRPGALGQLLEPFSRHGISMTRIESRPSRRGLWDYVFFIDLVGHVDDAHVGQALAELEDRTTLCRVLGSYPAAVA